MRQAPGAGGHAGRIAAVRWRMFRLPLRHRFEAAHSALNDRLGLVLELVSDRGQRGVGEASPFPALGDGTLDDTLALLGANAGVILDRPEAALRALPERGPGVMALRCAIDAALLDLEGKERGLTASELLSEGPRASVEVNAVIGSGRPAEVVGYAREAVAAGYRVLKLKVGVGEIAEDVARVRAVREACPGVAIRLDANGAWDAVRALDAIDAFEPFEVELIEQPVGVTDLAGLVRVWRDGAVRVAADEMVNSAQDAARVIRAKAADLLVLKPMRLGGARACLEIARQAAAAGAGCFVTTTFDSSIGTAVALHLAAALPRVEGAKAQLAHGLSTGEHLAADLVAEPLVPLRGEMLVPPAPGLGVELDEAALDAVATGPWVERLAGVR